MHLFVGRHQNTLPCLILLTAGLGCSRAPERELYAVQGIVTIDGRPAGHGTVSLRPLNAEQGHQPTGVVNAAGEYVVYTSGLPGAPPGAYRVLVFVHEQTAAVGAHPGLPQSLIDPQYQDPQRTPLRVHVTADPLPRAYDLEVQRAK